MRNSQVSAKRGATSCRPIGMPAAVKPQFIESAGCSPIFHGTVKTMCSNGRCGSFSGEAQSAGKASTWLVGVSSRSISPNSRAARRRISKVWLKPRTASTPLTRAPPSAQAWT